MFISQCLLCVTFIVMNTPELETETESGEILVEEFDEDAELQARIWNAFMRNQTHDMS